MSSDILKDDNTQQQMTHFTMTFLISSLLLCIFYCNVYTLVQLTYQGWGLPPLHIDSK